MIRIIRSMLLFLGYIFFSIGALIISFFVFPLLKFQKNFKQKASAVIQKTWFWLIKYLEFCQIIKVNYPKEICEIRNKVVVATHLSYVDIVILIALIPNSVCLVKQSLAKNFIMKNIIKSLYITNDEGVEAFEKQSSAAIDEGFNIIIFPTGQRVDDNEKVNIHKGAALISIKNNVSVVPIKIELSSEFLPKNKFFCDAGKKTVVFDIKIQDEIVPEFLREAGMSDISLRNKICGLIKDLI
ncbi:MAG: lysophospholipid acyltransferase family protein [Candidatus Gastranaerophilaceae bacterium]